MTDTVLKILSVMLSYPDEHLCEGQAWFKRTLRDSDAPDAVIRLLDRLIENIARVDPYEAQEHYVHLFDCTPALSLYLFDHIGGDGTESALARADLLTLYDDRGFETVTGEMPDYLPLFLEFLSAIPQEEADEILGDAADILAVIGARLNRSGSLYADAFSALSLLAETDHDISPFQVSRDVEDEGATVFSLH